MNALILGGENPRHATWVRQVSGALTPHFTTVRFLEYRHWQQGEPNVDITHEQEQAALLAQELGDDYIVVAKSIGTVIASLDIARGTLTPKRCVFMGIPRNALERQIEADGEILKSLPQTIVLQNEHDPLGSAAEVETFLKEHAAGQFQLRSLPGETHDYVDFDLIAQTAANS